MLPPKHFGVLGVLKELKLPDSAPFQQITQAEVASGPSFSFNGVIVFLHRFFFFFFLAIKLGGEC